MLQENDVTTTILFKLYFPRSDSSDDEQKSAFKPVPKLRGGRGYDEMDEYERELRRRQEEEEKEEERVEAIVKIL